MILIDGSFGEGGGQILRTSLALSLLTGEPFRIQQIRARRPKPGLMRQHLTAVRAAAEVGCAEVTGAVLGSGELTFIPRQVRPGPYTFDIGTAGSVTLVLQTVLPALMVARAPSELCLRGGTHNLHAPPFDFLQKAFLPLLNRMGPHVEVILDRHGFYPAGGGQMTVSVQPQARLSPIELLERGEVLRRLARAVICRLPRHIAQRELATLRQGLSWPEECTLIEEVNSPGPGNVLIVEIHSQHVTEVFSGFGRKGLRAQAVASRVIEQVREYLDADIPVGVHLADQLLIPLGLAGGGRFRTLAPSDHTQTNLQTLRQFLDVRITARGVRPGVWEIRIGD
ncbi:MAG: RNA 3'-terminal phosphate cyclase [Thermoguttaceae bacterium]